MAAKKNRLTWKGFHKWVGLVLTVFLLLFCISGIILNHREVFSGCSVSRSLLPAGYRISNYNNGIIKGTAELDGDTILAYGNSGIWLTDRNFSRFADFNDGLPEGVDGRNIKNIVRTKDGTLWCAAQFGAYNLVNGKWQELLLPGNDERISDLTTTPDSARVVILTRSAIYRPGIRGFERVEMQAPPGHEEKVSLFKTIWHIHSGDIFGLPGRIIVDIIAVIIIFLCITGIILFVLPYSIRRSVREKVAAKARHLKWNLRWHNKIGYWTIVLTLLIAATGMCLRPPLMIPFAMIKTSPVPGSVFDSENAWHDKLRGIRFDGESGRWLVSTSEGFFRVDSAFASAPEAASQPAPPVSPMGITVFEPQGGGKWLVGSFSGLYVWDMAGGSVTDYFTGQPYNKRSGRGGGATGANITAGYSADLDGTPVVFDYSKGAEGIGEMPEILARQPMSLWNFALELHVGRCYAPFLGPLSELYVFLSGLLLCLILVSGLIIHNRIKRNHNNHNQISH